MSTAPPNGPRPVNPFGYNKPMTKPIHELEIGVSSMITKMQFAPDHNFLFVTFTNGKIVRYDNVEADLALTFEREANRPGGSIGQLFIAEIRSQADKYPFTYVEEVTV